MTQRIDSDALAGVNEFLGIKELGAQQTLLDDGNISQVLVINPLVAAGRAIPGSAGQFYGLLGNFHVAAGTLVSSMDPYAPTNPTGGWPEVVPLGFSVWIGAFGSTCSIDIVVQWTSLHVLPGASNLGISAANDDVAITPPVRIHLAQWADYNDGSKEGNAKTPPLQHAYRLRRGDLIVWETNVGQTGNIFATFQLGLFPTGEPHQLG